MRIFILEDDPNRIHVFRKWLGHHDLTVEISTDRAVDVLLNEPQFHLLFFDHDLGGRQMVSSRDYETGAEVAKQLVAEDSSKVQDSIVVIHSLNYQGARNIHSILEPFALVQVEPIINFDWLKVREGAGALAKALEQEE